MAETDVRVYRHPNPEIRSYLTPDIITRPVFETFEPPLKDDSDRLSASLGTIGAQMVLEVLSLPGVAQIRIKPKELRIKKAPHASWDTLEEAILPIVVRAVRKSRIRVLKR